jgi:hypothetical protein
MEVRQVPNRRDADRCRVYHSRWRETYCVLPVQRASPPRRLPVGLGGKFRPVRAGPTGWLLQLSASSVGKLPICRPQGHWRWRRTALQTSRAACHSQAHSLTVGSNYTFRCTFPRFELENEFVLEFECVPEAGSTVLLDLIVSWRFVPLALPSVPAVARRNGLMK